MTLNTLLLDAGNTIVYLDHDVVGDIVGLDADRLREAEGVAKRRYEERLQRSRNHEDGWRVFVGGLLESAGATGDIDAQVTRLRAIHDEKNLWRRVPSELPAALQRIRDAGWHVGIVSNSEGRLVEILETVGVLRFFDVVIDSGVVGVSKPDPRIFELALEALGVGPSSAIYAGDVPDVDVVGARAAGMDAVLIDTLDHYPDYVEAPRFQKTATFIDSLL